MGTGIRVFVGLVIVALAVLEIGFASVLVDRRDPGLVAPLLLLPGLAGWLWWSFFRPSISLTSTELVLRNKSRTERVDLRTIEAVMPSSEGLVVFVGGRPAYVGWAVQKSNLAMWLRRVGRADQVAEQIRQAALAVGAPVRPAFGLPDTPPPDSPA
ncbi:hypothetical protein GCM10023196_067970 [Actinoallomurus vinaceus]|uniref:PH domain-containing protein n=2 Tax=Actinoallomurus vinaceus TaxID=1080074 RepID=A0ABP8ULG9_9ACTN